MFLSTLTRTFRRIRFILWLLKGLVKPVPKKRESLRIITGADSSHFKSLVQLLESVNRFEPLVSVSVYDLGLTDDQREVMKQVSLNSKDVTLKQFDFGSYPQHFKMSESAGSYAWKPAAVETELNQSDESLLLWLDAGDVLRRPLENVRRAIRDCGLWSPASAGTIAEWTHPTTLEKFSLPQRTLLSPNLNGAIVGVDRRCRKAKLAVHWWSLAANDKEWIAPKGSDRSNHRQDQSLLTLIAAALSLYSFPTNTLELATHQDVD